MNRSYIIAGALTLTISAWVLGGYLLRDSASPASPTEQATAAPRTEPMSVAVRSSEPQVITRYITSRGQAEPSRAVTVRAETSGRVATLGATLGDRVEPGDVLVALEINDRSARLEQAQAELRQHQRAYEAASKLGQKGYQAERQIDEIYAALSSAQARLAKIEIEIENVTIRAPFAGVLNDRKVELGDYLTDGGEVGTIVDNDPLVVSVQIAQQEIDRIERGAHATVTLATGESVKGTVRYFSARADEQTRTFRVEIEVPNPGRRIPSGLSAEARIPSGEVLAHFVSPAILSLDQSGALGLKAVSRDNTVVFHPVSIVQAGAAGVWVSGLPERATLITVGQGFVEAGEVVHPVTDSESPPSVGSRSPLDSNQGTFTVPGVSAAAAAELE